MKPEIKKGDIMGEIEFQKRLNAFSKFDTNVTVVSAEPYGNGHINDTFLVESKKENGERKRYILQRINTNVFKKPQEVMYNIEAVTDYLKTKTEDERKVLSLVRTKEGKAYHEDESGFWRLYDFVEDSICLEAAESKEDFYQSAIAFGEFQKLLIDFPVNKLYETIPDFHNTPDRYEKFLTALKNDSLGRAKTAKEEIEFVINRKDFCSTLFDAQKQGKLPFRVTHNDTKLNNVMLDEKTRTALCVIDLDTIMLGFSVNDFGDSIRFGASTAADDEKDLSKVWMDIDLFETYAKGFIKGCGGLLTKDEIELLPEGAKMMTLECGMRFLTDYLEGDTYFKTKYATQNLDRCRTQFKLVADMESKWDKMKEIIKKIAN